MARIVRGQVLSLRDRPFVEASRALGAGPLRILGRHIIPNVLGVVVVYLTLTVPAIVLYESFLSFLGLGIQAPMAELGLAAVRRRRSNQSHPDLLVADRLSGRRAGVNLARPELRRRRPARRLGCEKSNLIQPKTSAPRIDTDGHGLKSGGKIIPRSNGRFREARCPDFSR